MHYNYTANADTLDSGILMLFSWRTSLFCNSISYAIVIICILVTCMLTPGAHRSIHEVDLTSDVQYIIVVSIITI